MDEREIEIYRAVRAHELELNRAAVNFEHVILAPLFLLNGGAIVAFLTLLGATSQTNSELSLSTSSARWACVCWAGGLLAGVLATFFGFQSQRRYTRVERLRRQEVERMLLPQGSRLAQIVAAKDEKHCRDRERKAGQRLQWALNLAIALSVAAFLAGAWLAADSIL